MPDETPPGAAGSALLCRKLGKPLEASDARQVDAVEDHLELAGGQLDAVGIGLGIGKVVASRFQTLTPQAQAVAPPVQHLEPVRRAIAEDEEVARERVSLQSGRYQVGLCTFIRCSLLGVGLFRW